MDRDQAHCALALERAQPLLHAALRQAIAARTGHLDRDEIAVLRVAGGARRDRQFVAEVLLVDRREPPAAAGLGAEDAEHPPFGAINQLDDARAVADRIAVFAALLDPQERTVADADRFARPRTPRHADADFRRRAVRLLVPFRRHRDQIAVAVAAADISEHDLGQLAGVLQLLAVFLETAFVGQARAACA